MEYSANIIDMMPPVAPVAAVCIEENNPVAKVVRIHGFALVEESFDDGMEANNVIPLTESDDGILFLATALEGYVGMIEVMPGLILPESIDLQSESDDCSEALRSARRQVTLLVERRAAQQDERKPAQVVRLAKPEEPESEPDPEGSQPEPSSSDAEKD